LEGAVFAGVTAGLTARINLGDMGLLNGSAFSQRLLGAFGNGSLTLGNILEGAFDGLISSGLSSAIYGTDFGTGFSTALIKTVVNLALADVQTEIGDLGLAEGSLPHMLLHGLAGCAAAEAQGGSCAAGAAGGIAQSLYAGYLSGNKPQPGGYDTAAAYAAALSSWHEGSFKAAQLLGAMAGFFVSEGKADNISLAGTISVSGLKNNYLTHEELREYERKLAACGEDEQCLTRVEAERIADWKARQAEFEETCLTNSADCRALLNQMRGDLILLVQNSDTYGAAATWINTDIRGLLSLEWTMLEILAEQGQLTPSEQARLDEFRLTPWPKLIEAASMAFTIGKPGKQPGKDDGYLPPAGKDYHSNGYRAEFYDATGNPTKWRNPLTNQLEDIPPGMNVHKDHILPRNEVKKLDGYDELSPAEQKLILYNPKNYQPLEGSLNCSKGCTVEGSSRPWETYKGQPVNADYKDWLFEQQIDMADKLTELIREINNARGM
ncbi:DUF637 domain-containing protein, partial [Neorhizobium sp. T786]|uniref:DUF637 domain-containing protein n=1 Tax=Pseudorhizobium xiangyangii TaxID=2883104 RepID=UPI001CFF6760